MTRRLLLFTGAPVAAKLHWDLDLDLDSDLNSDLNCDSQRKREQRSTDPEDPLPTCSTRLQPYRDSKGDPDVCKTVPSRRGRWHVVPFEPPRTPSHSAHGSLPGSELGNDNAKASTHINAHADVTHDVEADASEHSFAVHELPSSPPSPSLRHDPSQGTGADLRTEDGLADDISTQTDSLPPSCTQSFDTDSGVSNSVPFENSTSKYLTSDHAASKHVTSDLATSKYATPNRTTTSQIPRAGPRKARLTLTTLGQLPSARDIQMMHPQPRLVSLVVSVLSIAAPRRKLVRRASMAMDLASMTVGDETASGFAIDVWLPCDQVCLSRSVDPTRILDQNDTMRQLKPTHHPHDPSQDPGLGPGPGAGLKHAKALRRKLAMLRPRDVVLVRNIALASFRGVVHGVSRRNATQLDLLHRDSQPTNSRKVSHIPMASHSIQDAATLTSREGDLGTSTTRNDVLESLDLMHHADSGLRTRARAVRKFVLDAVPPAASCESGPGWLPPDTPDSF